MMSVFLRHLRIPADEGRLRAQSLTDHSLEEFDLAVLLETIFRVRARRARTTDRRLTQISYEEILNRVRRDDALDIDRFGYEAT